MANLKTVKINFDGEPLECLVQVDGNGEFRCTARNGRFTKFPADCDFKAEVKAYNALHSVKPIFADEVEPHIDDELTAWFGGDEENVTEEDVSVSDPDPAPAEPVA